MNTRVVDRIDGPLTATVAVPGSKSIANRALVCAALARSRSELSNLPDGDDVTAMLACLRQLGVGVAAADSNSGRGTGGQTVTVNGIGLPNPAAGTVLDAGLAGTTSRFLVALAALSTTPVTVDGAEPLRRRPFGPLFDALGELGASVNYGAVDRHLPATLSGPLSRAPIAIAGDVSSQFISALMMIAPMIEGGVEMSVVGDLVSRPYVELTQAVMGRFGAPEVDVGSDLIAIAPGRYVGTEFEVEPDASSASYPLGLAAILGGSVTVDGLGDHSRQGDAGFARVLEGMGCEVAINDRSTTVTRAANTPLSGIDIDMSDISDLVPTLAAVAAFAETPTRIRGVGFIRAKESDRLGDLAAEFTKLGVTIAEEPDGLTISPSAANLHPGAIATHHDHRLAMAGGLLGAAIGSVTIEDPDVVTKSWPGFWTMLTDIVP